jgi:hypothetical protein
MIQCTEQHWVTNVDYESIQCAIFASPLYFFFGFSYNKFKYIFFSTSFQESSVLIFNIN